MKWQYASISLMVLVFLILLLAMLVRSLPATNNSDIFLPQITNENIQLGYYDLQGDKRELYNPRFEVRGGAVFITLTSPDDSSFSSKLKMQLQHRTPSGLLYSYQPLYYANPQGHRLVQNILSFMVHNGATLNGFEFENRRVVVMPSGLILSYDK
ncbi:hypothetical protein N5923_11370 [Erwiniaceae bacterium BAC15a-03b]|uniref:Uncharacterized protein n=1 Tax=Winslowiella arboricola TaxID=2978220 RepID=A0A9J6PID8_9GAMM|nr:hypothetical protein [Winslowiella arboricola]MCU5774501.1 hypothetical protein [Winslowiella arboricola]MCU5778089.1 hypothetical protein [Winslowiella arboricola]